LNAQKSGQHSLDLVTVMLDLVNGQTDELKCYAGPLD
jgi:hypothetical protein